MKNFIEKTILFALPLFIILGVLEWASRNVPNDYYLKNNLFETQADSVEVLTLGSSHALYGINPEFLPTNSLNAAYVSQSLLADFSILEKFFSRSERLRVVIVPISYFSLFSSFEKDHRVWRTTNYATHMQIYLTPQFKYRFESLGLPASTFIKKTERYYLKNRSFITCSPSGWGTAYKSPMHENLETTGPVRAKGHTHDDTLLAYNTRILEEIMAFLSEREISIILLTTPTYKTYYENLNEAQLDTTIETCRRETEGTPRAIYLNLLHDDRFTATDFYDADHLNDIGAQKLSKILAEQIALLSPPQSHPGKE